MFTPASGHHCKALAYERSAYVKSSMMDCGCGSQVRWMTIPAEAQKVDHQNQDAKTHAVRTSPLLAADEV
jgi:hypothetical protein